MSLPNMQTSPLSASTYRTRNGTTSTGPTSLAAQHQLCAQYRAAAVEDMAHKSVRLDTVTFRDTFFPLPEGVSLDDRPQWDRDIFKGVEDAKNMTEAKISEAFIMALNTVTGLTPNLTLAESQHCPDKGDAAGIKVDAGFFRPNYVPTDGRPHWVDQIVPVEFKPHDTARDPYDDRPKMPLDSGTITRKQVRGQIIHYAEQIFKYQHRTELYMLLILGRRYQFLRWDRSGTIVTPAMDYYEDSDLLCEMLWRMSLLNDEQLGLDPTAERIPPKTSYFEDMDAAAVSQPSDIDHAPRYLIDDEIIPDDFVFRYVREAFANSLDPTWPRYCLSVPHGTGVRKFLVAKPDFHASGMAGRGTRGYVTLDLETGRFVWLKDAWRAHYELVDMEGAILADLNRLDVSNVPTLVCHGDILNQATRTPDFWKPTNLPATTSSRTPPPRNPPKPSSSRTLATEIQTPSVKPMKRGISEVDDSDATLAYGEPRDDCPFRRHKHYRVVVQEVCMPLVKFESGRQLLEIVHSCVIAHRDAMNIAHIVHRDVSGGNILILPTIVDMVSGKRLITWWGVLADWELSKPVHDKPTPPRARQPERTGTWQYMSVATLDEHSKVVETPDELESFFHVVLYYGVRYLTSNCTDAASFIESFFDSYSVVNKKYLCGKAKRTAMYQGVVLLDGTTEHLAFNSSLDTFLSELLEVFKAHYLVTMYDKDQAEKAKKATEPRPFASDDPFDIPVVLHSGKKTKSPLAPLPQKHRVSRKEAVVPSEAQRSLALKVRSHDCLEEAITVALEEAYWTLPDRVKGDNVSSTWTPMVAVGPTPVASNKKLRTETSSFVASGGLSGSLSAQFSAST